MSDTLRALNVPNNDIPKDVVRLVTEALLTSPGPSLRQVQAEALWEIADSADYQGGFLAAGAGEGKTLIALLAGTVLGVDRVLYLAPPGLQNRPLEEAHVWGETYDLTIPTCMAYSTLSSKHGEAKLRAVRPQLIILDEADCVANTASARTKRLIRFLVAHPEVPVMAMSGTLLSGKLGRAALVLEFTHGEHGSPLPTEHDNLLSWSAVVDPDGEPSKWDVKNFRQVQKATGEEDPNRAIGAQVKRKSGCVMTTSASCQSALQLTFRVGSAPEYVTEALAHLRDCWETPDGEMLFSSAIVAGQLQRLSLGYYYRWVYQPGDVWMEARAEWARELRGIVQYKHHAGFDTPATVTWALQNDKRKRARYPRAVEIMDRWFAMESTRTPPTEAVWLDDGAYALRVAAALLKAQKRGPLDPRPILWVRHQALADLLGAAGYEVFDGTVDPDPAERGDRPLVLKIGQYGVGKHLAAWRTSSIMEVPAGSRSWEQLLARHHRVGQEADRVIYHVGLSAWPHSARIKRVGKLALVDQNRSHQPQRFLFADRIYTS